METRLRQRPSRRLPAERARDRGLRGRARRRRRASSTPPIAREIVFTKNSTEAMNLVAHGWGRGVMKPGQAVLISELEHHANIVPWQMLRDDARHRTARLPRDRCRRARHGRPRRRSWRTARSGWSPSTHMSNVLGTVTPAERIVAHGACGTAPRCCSTARQAAVHRRVDVQAIGCDFYVLHRPQAVRADRHRRALGAAGAPGRACRPSSAAAT